MRYEASILTGAKVGTDPCGQMTNAQSLESRQGVSCQELLPPLLLVRPHLPPGDRLSRSARQRLCPGRWCEWVVVQRATPTGVGGGDCFRKYLRHESPSLELENITQIRKFPEARESLHRAQLLQQSLAFEKQPLFLFRGDFPASPGTTRTHR